MVNDCADRSYAKNVFPEKRLFCLNKAKKGKKKLFSESLDQRRRLEVREIRQANFCFFVMSLHLSDHKVLHNIASSSSFFSISLGFSRFFSSYFVLQIFGV